MKLKIFAIAVFAVFSVAASAGTNFLNVDIQATEGESGTTDMSMRIPMGLLHVMAPQLGEALGKVDIQHEGLDLAQMWELIRETGPNRYAEIESKEADVTIETTETHLLISITDTPEGDLSVTMPLALGDVLFGNENAEPQELIAALEDLEGDLVTIEGEMIQGRVWMD